MKWYLLKEQAAGTKRLLLLYYIYGIFGRNAVKFLIYFITFFAFRAAKEIRKNSAKYLKIIGLEPSFKNQYRHFLEYSLSLLDRMEVFSGKFDLQRISFANENDRAMLDKDFDSGIFFICSHLGNIDVMRALLKKHPEKHIRVFLAKDQCKIFNNFIKSISEKTEVTTYPVEEIGLETSIETKESLNKGEFVFIAGDRTSKNAANFQAKLFSRNVELPLGTFRFAQLMEVPVYFVCALKDEQENYKIYLKKFTNYDSKKTTLINMQNEYIEFLENNTRNYPFQFFHFYDMFDKD